MAQFQLKQNLHSNNTAIVFKLITLFISFQIIFLELERANMISSLFCYSLFNFPQKVIKIEIKTFFLSKEHNQNFKELNQTTNS